MKLPATFSTIVPANATSERLLLENTRQQLPSRNVPAPMAISAPAPAALTKSSGTQQHGHDPLAKSKGDKHRRKR